MASRLEQLDRIAVEIFNLNLLAARAYLHFIFKTHTRLFQVSDARRQILHLKKHTVPSAGLLLTDLISNTPKPHNEEPVSYEVIPSVASHQRRCFVHMGREGQFCLACDGRHSGGVQGGLEGSLECDQLQSAL
jgi:hypothetical protein